MKRGKRLHQASAPTSLKVQGSICSSVLKAIISPSSVCRCCNCSRFCELHGCLRYEGRKSACRHNTPVMPAKAGIRHAVRPQSITHISEYWTSLSRMMTVGPVNSDETPNGDT